MKLILLALIVSAPGLVWTQPVPGDRSPLEKYDRITAQLSEPLETRWKPFVTPYFSSNEKLLHLFYPAFDDLGGVVIGVSFQQNLSLLVHARPELYVVFDINPGVTEILLPFFGLLMERAKSRQEFVSLLLGVDLTPEEARQILELRTSELHAADANVSPATVIEGILKQADSAKRQARLEELKNLMTSRILARLPSVVTPAMRTEALAWLDVLQKEEVSTGVFFGEAAAPYSLSSHAVEQRRLGSWLSTEYNYQMVRDYWMSGRLIGVTGDLSGPGVAKLADLIRSSTQLANPQVTGFYLSNIGLSTQGHFQMDWFQKLYSNLGQLPIAPHAMTLVAQGPRLLTGYTRSFGRARWVYDTLESVPVNLAIQLHEAPLEIGVQLGRDSVVPELERRLLRLMRLPVKSGFAPVTPYVNLLKQIAANVTAVRFFNPEQFRDWAKKTDPEIDVDSPGFKTITVTLAEAGLLLPPAPSVKPLVH